MYLQLSIKCIVKEQQWSCSTGIPSFKKSGLMYQKLKWNCSRSHTHIQVCACTHIHSAIRCPTHQLNTLAHTAWWSHKHAFSFSRMAIFLLSTAAPIKHDILLFVPKSVTFNMAYRKNWTALDSWIYVSRIQILRNLLNMMSHFITAFHKGYVDVPDRKKVVYCMEGLCTESYLL